MKNANAGSVESLRRLRTVMPTCPNPTQITFFPIFLIFSHHKNKFTQTATTMTAGDDTTAPATPSPPPEKITVRGLQSNHVEAILGFFTNVWNAAELPESAKTKDFFSDLIRGLLKVDRIERGRVSCSFKAELPVTNFYKGLHGGAVAAVAERVATACARTVVAEDRELFLGELSISYLAAAAMYAEVAVDASLVRSGRSITVVSVEFRLKETGKLVYTAHATFFNLSVSKL